MEHKATINSKERYHRSLLAQASQQIMVVLYRGSRPAKMLVIMAENPCVKGAGTMGGENFAPVGKN